MVFIFSGKSGVYIFCKLEVENLQTCPAEGIDGCAIIAMTCMNVRACVHILHS